jgi:hypothetical protein
VLVLYRLATRGYGRGVAVLLALAFAGAIVLAGRLALLAAPLVAGALVAGVVAGVATTTGVLAGVAGRFALLALFAGASPQAMPRALNPRTVESAITFLILFSDSYLSQRFI